MTRTIINPENNWKYWNKELLSELNNVHLNHNIGDKLVYENDKFSVWTIHLKPGKRLPFHTHNAPYFWTALTTGKARSYFDNGLVVESSYDVGETKNFPDLSDDNFFIHDLENIGDSVLIFSTVEFKIK